MPIGSSERSMAMSQGHSPTALRRVRLRACRTKFQANAKAASQDSLPIERMGQESIYHKNGLPPPKKKVPETQEVSLPGLQAQRADPISLKITPV